ncbi:MAG TPA: hypothetical protein VK797_23435 [Tepidisphaeraceae bacterium]|nr:hypothetical protein [Tepidisphaeraceae bacterium]
MSIGAVTFTVKGKTLRTPPRSLDCELRNGVWVQVKRRKRKGDKR